MLKVCAGHRRRRGLQLAFARRQLRSVSRYSRNWRLPIWVFPWRTGSCLRRPLQGRVTRGARCRSQHPCHHEVAGRDHTVLGRHKGADVAEEGTGQETAKRSDRLPLSYALSVCYVLVTFGCECISLRIASWLGRCQVEAQLNDIALSLAEKSGAFSSSLPPAIAGGLAELIRIVDCYYSNLIEGYRMHPIDIERSIAGVSIDEETKSRRYPRVVAGHDVLVFPMSRSGKGSACPLR